MKKTDNGIITSVAVTDVNGNTEVFHNVIKEVWLDEVGVYLISFKDIVSMNTVHIKFRISIIHNVRVFCTNNDDRPIDPTCDKESSADDKIEHNNKYISRVKKFKEV